LVVTDQDGTLRTPVNPSTPRELGKVFFPLDPQADAYKGRCCVVERTGDYVVDVESLTDQCLL
jgi:hypothetical protein